MSAVIPRLGKPYVLVNVATGTVMDMSGNDNTSVIGFTDNATDNQQWYFEERNGGVAIHCKRDVKYLAVGGAVQNSTGMVAQSTQDPQLFSVEATLENNQIQIFIKDTNFLVDLSQSDATPGTSVICFENRRTANQFWKAVEVTNA